MQIVLPCDCAGDAPASLDGFMSDELSIRIGTGDTPEEAISDMLDKLTALHARIGEALELSARPHSHSSPVYE